MGTIHRRTVRDGPTMDDVYGILAHGERRAILDHLESTDGELYVHALVERFSERSDVSERATHRYYIRLVHQHLPKMAEAGLVAYDPDNERVSITSIGARANAVRRRGAEVFREN